MYKTMIQNPPLASSFMDALEALMAGLENGESRSRIIASRLNGDSELFGMMLLFLRANKWIAEDNKMTDKGRLWMEGYCLVKE